MTGPRKVCAVGRVADGQFVGQLFQLGDQLIVDRFLDEDARGGGAFLSLQAKCRADDAGAGAFQVRVPRNDGRDSCRPVPG